jgi:hypothetical protein
MVRRDCWHKVGRRRYEKSSHHNQVHAQGQARDESICSIQSLFALSGIDVGYVTSFTLSCPAKDM